MQSTSTGTEQRTVEAAAWRPYLLIFYHMCLINYDNICPLPQQLSYAGLRLGLPLCSLALCTLRLPLCRLLCSPCALLRCRRLCRRRGRQLRNALLLPLGAALHLVHCIHTYIHSTGHTS